MMHGQLNINLSQCTVTWTKNTCVYFVGTVIVLYIVSQGTGCGSYKTVAKYPGFLRVSPPKYAFIYLLSRTCLARFIVLGSITRMVFPTRHTSWSPCLLCSWHTAVTSRELPSACMCYKPIPTFRTLLNWSFHLLLCLPKLSFSGHNVRKIENESSLYFCLNA
jgi:hypothetical protein